ncbi:MAG: CRISPR system precrRNA processing endoribonuclease RAMP protein Cas6 [candidate division NC10 bacterium]|nr:CRISPR system precrRNA processing endoribonuclease RAMP protein Cas6 [candidate division NC10 bacterium]
MEDRIALSRYCFTLEVLEEMALPQYLGSTLRGGFGHVFRRIACPGSRLGGKACPLPEQCPYHLIFEPSPPPDATALRNLEEIPRPFVIAPPFASERSYQVGSTFSFDLTLVGKAIPFLPYFIVAFKELGNRGLGRGQKPFRVTQITAIDPIQGWEEPIYTAEDEMVRTSDAKVTLAACRAMAAALLTKGNPTALRLAFLTPTRLKFEGHLVDTPEFHIVFRSLLRRLSSLALFHCGTKLDVDYRSLITQAQQVQLVRNETRWVDWERYSSRQKERMFLGGLVGEAAYAGEFRPLLPYLLFGQWTHVGKNATFGLGKYEVELQPLPNHGEA